MKINRIRTAKNLFFLAILFLTVPSALHAQAWTVKYLNPGEATMSKIYAASGSQQVGQAVFDEDYYYHAGIWSGTAESFVDLHPIEYLRSKIRGTNGSQQVGDVDNVAALWNGTQSSFVSLWPGEDYDASYALATNGSRQVGYSVFDDDDFNNHAALWSGTAASFVDLHPAEATQSIASAIVESQQFGFVEIGGVEHAARWSGTAASFVDLHPASAGESGISGASGSQQVGYVSLQDEELNSRTHAGIWSGTAASFVDIHPLGTLHSVLFATDGIRQVGCVKSSSATGPEWRAGVWSGTAASFVDLHAFLPAYYTDSRATGIGSVDGFVQVSGNAYNSVADREEAVLWVLSSTPPLAPAKAKLKANPKPFAATVVGKRSATQTLTVTNIGGKPLTGLRVSTSGGNKADFLLTRPSRVTLAPGVSATFKVTFKPKAAGTRKTNFEIRSNAPLLKGTLKGQGKSASKK